jgi:hypothetical protein
MLFKYSTTTLIIFTVKFPVINTTANIVNIQHFEECRILGYYFLRSVLQLLVAAKVVSSSPILFTMMTEALHFSETSVLTKVTRRSIQEDGILHSHHRENIKSYIELTGWAL